MRFQGRTPYVDDPVANQDALLASMRGARFTLSFNNVASPAEYTHHQHQYVTGRWTDALANGATVAGISPRCAVTREVLWPEGLLELSSAEWLGSRRGARRGGRLDAGAARDSTTCAPWS